MAAAPEASALPAPRCNGSGIAAAFPERLPCKAVVRAPNTAKGDSRRRHDAGLAKALRLVQKPISLRGDESGRTSGGRMRSKEAPGGSTVRRSRRDAVLQCVVNVGSIAKRVGEAMLRPVAERCASTCGPRSTERVRQAVAAREAARGLGSQRNGVRFRRSTLHRGNLRCAGRSEWIVKWLCDARAPSGGTSSHGETKNRIRRPKLAARLAVGATRPNA